MAHGIETTGNAAMIAQRPARRADQPTLEGEGLVLRPWDADLLRQMAEWGERGFPYHAFDLGHLRDGKRARKMLEWVRADVRHRHFVACENGHAVGRVSVNLEDPAGLYVWAVHVPPEHSGRGICRRMLRVVTDWLRATQPERPIVLTTNTFATAAHRAYRAVGFQIVETRWQYDAELSRELWRRRPGGRGSLAPHLRFRNGRWEVRAYLMRFAGA